VPLNILLAEREIAYPLEDSAAKAYFCFEGTSELRTGEAGFAAFTSVPGCETFILITTDPAGASPWAQVQTLAEFRGGPADPFRETFPMTAAGKILKRELVRGEAGA
jgi:long-chain acyl-CoA synthetase